jgi:hypothetical protein
MNERSFIVKSESDRELNSGLQVIFLIRRKFARGEN